jgi:hypothetical protein
MAQLKIKPADSCKYDLLSLGEIMLRLDPGEGRIRTTRASFVAGVSLCPLAMVPNNSSNSAPIRRYVNSTIPILCLCTLYLMSITSPRILRDHFSVSSKALANGPNVSSSAHLQDNFIERPSRWAKHHVAQARIVCPLMAGTLQTSTRGVEIHGTPRVRAPSAVSPVFALARAQQHSRIVSCWIVEVEAGSW